jgi:hypothetical protein
VGPVLTLSSLALALAATALLVMGLLGEGGLLLFGLSIACSTAAALVLRAGLRRRAVSPG